MAPTLYIFHGSPPARAVMVTAKALGIPLSIHEVNAETGELYSPEYLKINPQHTVPTLVDNGNIICESHAINAYLVGKYGKDDALYPKDLYKRALVDQKLHFDTGVLFVHMKSVVDGLMKKQIKEVSPAKIAEINETYELLEQFLKGRQWIAGDSVTIADFSCVTTATTVDVISPIDPKKFPNVTNWIKRALALPYFVSEPEKIESFKQFYNSIR